MTSAADDQTTLGEARANHMAENNIYWDGKVNVLDEECLACIFRPHARLVEGRRVAQLAAETMDEPGATIVCHSTLYNAEDNAICRGWRDS